MIGKSTPQRLGTDLSIIPQIKQIVKNSCNKRVFIPSLRLIVNACFFVAAFFREKLSFNSKARGLFISYLVARDNRGVGLISRRKKRERGKSAFCSFIAVVGREKCVSRRREKKGRLRRDAAHGYAHNAKLRPCQTKVWRSRKAFPENRVRTENTEGTEEKTPMSEGLQKM